MDLCLFSELFQYGFSCLYSVHSKVLQNPRGDTILFFKNP
jgi:hypothetical protein